MYRIHSPIHSASPQTSGNSGFCPQVLIPWSMKLTNYVYLLRQEYVEFHFHNV
jgi:hypothetical protein